MTMTMKWKMSLGAAVLALCLPALTLAAPTGNELLQKAMPPGAAAKAAEQSKAREAQRARFMELQTKKKALIKQRREAARAHNLKGRVAAMNELKKVNAEMNKLGKGGAIK